MARVPLLPLLSLLAFLAAPACQARLLGRQSGARRLLDEVLVHLDIAHHHKHQPAPPGPGLPQECLTYNERYGHHYHTGLPHSGLDNALHAHSKYVVLLKLHKAFDDGWPLDLILHVRAVAAEVTAAGYHFYILYQPPHETTREEALDGLPFDLRPFLVIHDYEDDYHYYSALGAHDNEGREVYDTWGPGPRAAYTAVTRFMMRYKAYDYAWIIEHDARWTGSSWGELLNAALDLGRQATQQELAADPKRLANASRVASRSLPASTDGLPDLLTFGGMDVGSTWHILPNNMANSSQLHSIGAEVYLGSRRLWELAHEYSLKGIGSHIEAALSTIAVENGLKAAGIGLPTNETFPGYYSCCSSDALQIYGAWHNNTATCAPSSLLHPVKNTQAYWPKFEFDA